LQSAVTFHLLLLVVTEHVTLRQVISLYRVLPQIRKETKYCLSSEHNSHHENNKLYRV